MTKHDLIAKRLAAGMPPQEIARECDCRVEYVRAVRNRERNKVRTGTVCYPGEALAARRQYHANPEIRDQMNELLRHRYRTDPEFRAAKRAASKAWYWRRKAKREAMPTRAP